MLAMAAALAYWCTALVINNDWWVKHTHEVLDNMDLLVSTLKDAETGHARLPVDEGILAYLEPYNAAVAGWEKPYGDLSNVTS